MLSQRATLGSFTPSAESNLDLPYDLDDPQITALIEFFQILVQRFRNNIAVD
jgi:hypothetical protein